VRQGRNQKCGMAILIKCIGTGPGHEHHGQDARATSRVGTSGAGPRPNAVRPDVVPKMFARKTKIYGIAMQPARPLIS